MFLSCLFIDTCANRRFLNLYVDDTYTCCNAEIIFQKRIQTGRLLEIRKSHSVKIMRENTTEAWYTLRVCVCICRRRCHYEFFLLHGGMFWKFVTRIFYTLLDFHATTNWVVSLSFFFFFFSEELHDELRNEIQTTRNTRNFLRNFSNLNFSCYNFLNRHAR